MSFFAPSKPLLRTAGRGVQPTYRFADFPAQAAAIKEALSLHNAHLIARLGVGVAHLHREYVDVERALLACRKRVMRYYGLHNKYRGFKPGNTYPKAA